MAADIVQLQSAVCFTQLVRALEALACGRAKAWADVEGVARLHVVLDPHSNVLVSISTLVHPSVRCPQAIAWPGCDSLYAEHQVTVVRLAVHVHHDRDECEFATDKVVLELRATEEENSVRLCSKCYASRVRVGRYRHHGVLVRRIRGWVRSFR